MINREINMNIAITSLNFRVTEYIKKHIANKLQKLFRQNPRVQNISVLLKKDNKHFEVTTQAFIKGVKKPLLIKTRSELFYSALSKSRDRLNSVLVQSKARYRKKGLQKASHLILNPG